MTGRSVGWREVFLSQAYARWSILGSTVIVLGCILIAPGAFGCDPDQDLSIAGRVLEAPDASLLDVLDNLLNKGVMVSGDVTLGVAGIDLIYLRLSSILCAADRVLPPGRGAGRRPSRHRKPVAGRHRR